MLKTSSRRLQDQQMFAGKGYLPDNVSNTLKGIKFSGFQNIKVALRIIGTLLVT